MDTKYNSCRKCDKKIPSTIVIDGKHRNLSNRKFCFDCSPWGSHNTKADITPTSRPPCLCCGKEVGKGGKIYCSNRCQQDLAWKNKKEQYETTGAWAEGVIGESFTSQLNKKYILEKRGIRCEVCGNTHWQGKDIPLILDHIDGNSSNNDHGNLRLVCGNCDMQLPTYKSKNRGNGRASRRQRYAEGKSY